MASALFKVCSALTLLALFTTPAESQPEVDALRLYLGSAGTTCTLHSGSGAPSSGLGAVCDTYHRTDSPYTVYVKTGGSTWTALVAMPGGVATGDLLTVSSSTSASRVAAVAAGQVLASAGTNVNPVYTASPSLTSIGGAANLTLNPTGDVVFNPTGNDLLPTTGYDLNIGALTNKFLTLHAAELWVETLVAQDTMATIGGRVLVGPTTTLTADLASGATSIQVKHNQIANGDRLVLQANGSLEWLAVTSAASGSAGAYIYSVTRNLDGSGANDWAAGDAVFNTGTTGDGFIDLYSVNGVIPGSTAGPTIVGNVRTGTTYSDVAPRWAIGNLNGLYGYGADTYGAAFGNPSAAWVKIDPTNGIRIGHNSTTKIQLDASGNASFAEGNLAIDSTGITMSPAAAGVIDANRSYRFTVDTGRMGVYGFRDSGDTIRDVHLQNFTNDAAVTPSLKLVAESPDGATSIGLVGDSSAGIAFSAASSSVDFVSGLWRFNGNIDVEFPDLSIFGNNGSTTAQPYIRSDGNYLLIESRSSANGGVLYLNNDTNATIDLGGGGGAINIGHGGIVTIATAASSASIYNATMYTSLTLNGLASCTLAVNGSGAVGCVSDGDAKTDVRRWRGGLDAIARLKPVSFRWKEGDTDRHIGFIAQDVDDVIPEAVRRQPWADGGLTLDDKAILAALVNAVQELQRRIR